MTAETLLCGSPSVACLEIPMSDASPRPGLGAEDRPQCGHTRVEWRTEQYPMSEEEAAASAANWPKDGIYAPPRAGMMLTRGWHQCRDCDTHFAPIRAVSSPAPTATPDAPRTLIEELLNYAEHVEGCEGAFRESDCTCPFGPVRRRALAALRVPTPEASVAGTSDLAELFSMIARRDPSVTELYDTPEFGERAARVYAALRSSPMTREQVNEIMDRARRQVKPIIDREREGERITDEVMNLRFRASSPEGSPPTAPVASPEETREPTDTERLDWLSKYPASVDYFANDMWRGWVHDDWIFFLSLRAAIDAALSAPSQPGETP